MKIASQKKTLKSTSRTAKPAKARVRSSMFIADQHFPFGEHVQPGFWLAQASNRRALKPRGQQARYDAASAFCAL